MRTQKAISGWNLFYWIMLFLAAYILIFALSPAVAHGEGRTATYEIENGTVTITFKDDVLVLEDNGSESSNFSLDGTDNDSDGIWDVLSLRVQNGSAAAQAANDQVVFIQSGKKLYAGKVTGSTADGTGTTLALASDQIALSDYALKAANGTIYPIWFDETIAGVDFVCEKNENLSFVMLTFDFEGNGLGYDTTITLDVQLTDVTATAEKKTTIDYTSVTLMSIPAELIPGVKMAEGCLDLWVKLDDVSGYAKFNVGTRLVLTGWLGLGKSELHVDESSMSPSVTITSWGLEGVLHIGPALKGVAEIKFDLFGVSYDAAHLSLSLGAGVKAAIESDKSFFSFGDVLLHTCNAVDDGKPHCWEGDMYPAFVVHSDWKFLRWDGTLVDWIKDLEDPFAHFYYSSAYGDFGFTSCPHRSYRLYVNVKDIAGLPVEGAYVGYIPVLDELNYVDKSWTLTNSQGRARLYVPTVEGYDTVQIVASVNIPTRDGKTVYWYDYAPRFTEKGIFWDANFKPKLYTDHIDITMGGFKHLFFKSNIKADLPETVRFFMRDALANIPDDIPQADGYTFVEWNSEQDGTGTPYAPGSLVHTYFDDVTLYAIWKPGPIGGKYTLYFNANGGSYAPPPVEMHMDRADQLTYKEAVWDKHEFKGWSLQDDSFEATFLPSQLVHANELNPDKDRSVTLYAVWGFNPVDMPVSLTYDMNGGPEEEKPSRQWVMKYSSLQITGRIPYWNNLYHFAGWSHDKNAAVADYQPGASIYMTEDTVLYAVWQMNVVPGPNRIEFKDTGSGTATNIPPVIYFEHREGVEVNLPDTIPVKPGLNFIGWNTAEDGSGTAYMPGARIRPSGDMILYAKWHLLSDQYTIIYNPNGGTSGPSPQFAPLGGTTVLSSEPAVWENHKFLGWSLDDDASTPEFPAGQVNTLTNPSGSPVIVLYAVWGFEPVDLPVRLTFDMNGGPDGQKPADQWIKPGGWIQIPDKTPVWSDEYIFNGWSRDPHASAGEYAPGSSILMEENTTLYAVWYYLPSGIPIRITYDLNGGLSNLPEDQETYVDLFFTLSTQKPAWDGQHIFLGWSPNRNDTTPMYQPGQRIRFHWNTKLYAIWKTKYRITQGNGSTWKTNSSRGLRFVANGSLTYFRHLEIDGKIVAEKDYILTSGSTIADLKRDYLKGLSVGTHSIRFRYSDGCADGTFTVKKRIPSTGDTANFTLYAGLILLGLAGIGIPILRRRRKKT